MSTTLDLPGLIRKLAQVESEGAAFYKSLAKNTDNEKIRKLAETMARVEKQHQVRFEKLVNNLEKRSQKMRTGKLTSDIRKYVLALIDHRIFLTPEQAEIAASNLADADEAVDMAIRFEKENILLLLECRDIVGGAEKKLLETIIGQEKAHIRSLERIRQQFAE